MRCRLRGSDSRVRRTRRNGGEARYIGTGRQRDLYALGARIIFIEITKLLAKPVGFDAHHRIRRGIEILGGAPEHLARDVELRELRFLVREILGAQVLEQPDSRVVIFADVDLSPDEVAGDFAHEPLAERSELGTVGLQALVHGQIPANDGGISIGQAAVAAAASHD